jgi:hypothetical protein
MLPISVRFFLHLNTRHLKLKLRLRTCDIVTYEGKRRLVDIRKALQGI